VPLIHRPEDKLADQSARALALTRGSSLAWRQAL
jgi:hypothetical protein